MTDRERAIEAAKVTKIGIERLAEPEWDDLRDDLTIFVNHWGLDAYTPPDQVRQAVRDIVRAVVIDALAARPDKP